MISQGASISSRQAGAGGRGFCQSHEPVSGEQFLDDATAELAQLFLPSLVKVAEPGVIQSEQVEQSYMEVRHGVNHLDRLPADLIGGSDHFAGLDTTAGKPDGHSLGVVIPAKSLRAPPDAIVGRTPKLAAPDNQGAFQ